MEEKIVHTRNLVGAELVYFMDKGSGTVVKDMSSKGVDGTAANCTWATGYFGKCLDFNGTSSVVTATNIITKKPLTFRCWAKLDDYTANRFIIDSRDTVFTSAGKGFYIADEDNDGSFDVGIGDGTNYVIASEKIDLSDGEWHHIVVACSASAMNIYVDGELQSGSPHDISSVTGALNQAANLSIGRRNYTAYAYFDGKIDEVYIINSEWSQGDVTYDYLALGDYVVSLTIKDSITEYCKSFEFTIPDPESNIYDKFQFLDDVRVFFDTTRMVRGRVMDLERPEYEVVIKGLDYTSRLLDRNITGSKTYKNCELSTIITNDTDGLETYFPDLTDNNVQTTQITLGNAADDGVTWVEKRIFFAMMELAKIAPDYEFYIDADLDIHFEPRRTVDSGLTITQDEFWEYNFPKVGKEVYTEIMVYGSPTSSWKAVKCEDSTAMLTWGSSGRPFRRSAPPLIDFELTDEDVAYKRGVAMLRRYSNPIEPGFGVVILEDYKTLRSGQLVKVEISELGIDAYYVVLEAVFQVPDMTLSLKLIENRKGHEEELREFMEKVFTLEVRDIDTSSFVYYQNPIPETLNIKYDWTCTKITPVGNGAERQSYSYGERNVDVRESGTTEEVVDQGTGVL